MLLKVGHADQPKMEDGSRQRSVRRPRLKNLNKVLYGASAAGSNHGNMRHTGNRSRQLHVKTILRPIAVHGRNQKLSCPSLLRLTRPTHGVAPGGVAPAGFLYL
jgi:hypothetical protein